MLHKYEDYQENVLSILTNPFNNAESAQLFLMRLHEYDGLCTYEKLSLLNLSHQNSSYKNLGHLLISANYAQKSELVSSYLNLLKHLLDFKIEAFEICDLFLKNLGCDGQFGNYLAKYGTAEHVRTFQQLLLNLLSCKLPESYLLALLQQQTNQGWTFGHYLVCHQSAEAFQQYCQLLQQLLNRGIPATAIFSLLHMPNYQGYGFGCYVACYQNTEGFHCYLSLLEHLLTLYIPSDWVMRALRQGKIYRISLGHHLLRENIEKNLLYLSFLERGLDRDFSPHDVALLLFVTDDTEISIGRLLVKGGKGQTFLHLIQRLEEEGIDNALISLLKRASEADCNPLTIARSQAKIQVNIAPVFALLKQGYLSEPELNKLMDCKTAVYEYIKHLPNGPEKLTVVERCLDSGDRYSLGHFFHSQRGLAPTSMHRGNLQRLAELAQQLKRMLADQPTDGIEVPMSALSLHSALPPPNHRDALAPCPSWHVTRCQGNLEMSPIPAR